MQISKLLAKYERNVSALEQIEETIQDSAVYERGNYSPADHSYVLAIQMHPHSPYVCGFTTPGRDVPLGGVPWRRLVGGGA